MRKAQPKGALPLAGLRAFEAVARVGSFLAAADDLGVTPSALSHQVRDLEAGLGRRLFDRGHRTISLTQAGAELVATLTPAFADIHDAYAIARGGVRLRLSAAPLFAARYILPTQDELQALIPGVRIEVESSLAHADLAGHPDMMALSFGPRPRAATAFSVAASASIVVAAPGAPETQSGWLDIDSTVLLGLSRRASHWEEALKVLGQPMPRRLIEFDSIEGALHNAEAGHGVALLPRLVCLQAIEAGRLEQVLPGEVGSRWRYWLCAYPGTAAARRLAPVADWLRRQVSPEV